MWRAGEWPHHATGTRARKGHQIQGLVFSRLDRLSPAGEDRFEPRFREDAFDLFSFVALYLDTALLHGASNTAGLLHLLGKGLFFGLSDSREVLDHGNRLATAMRSLPDDVHASAVSVFLSPSGSLCRLAFRVARGVGISRVLGAGRQLLQPRKPRKRSVSQILASACRFAFLLAAHGSYLGK